MKKCRLNERLSRLFREFPWLWAVRSEWEPTAKIQVKQANRLALRMKVDDRCYYSIIWKDENGVVGLGPGWLQFPSNESLSERVKMVLKCNQNRFQKRHMRVVYIFAIRERKFFGGKEIKNGPITIWRAPRGEDLHDMCMEKVEAPTHLGG